MALHRVLIIVGLVGLIVGGSGYFAYELFWKPGRIDRQEKQAKAAGKAPEIPDFTLPAFEKAASLERAGDFEGARAAWSEYIQTFPDAPRAGQAKVALGKLNTAMLLSPRPGPEKATYVVARGDSLVKVASKYKSSPELIFRTNNLDSINLQVGQQLVIPRLDTSLSIDRKAGTVTVLNKGQFFKEYHTRAMKIPPGAAPTKVSDKFALQGSNRVAFGEKNYAGSERWIMLGSGGLAIRGIPEGSDSPPPGIILLQEEMEEIFLLVSRGTPVTIKALAP